jgi:hypothetical protein
MTMTAFFAAVWAYEQANWQHQLVDFIAALPSIIVAATPYPKVDGALKKLLQVLNIFSVLTHSDSPSTLKAPFTQSAAPSVIGQTVTTVTAVTAVPPPKGFVSLWLALAIATFCALFSGHAKAWSPSCSTLTFTHGLSLGMTEISPAQPNPVQLAPGLGYMGSVGICQTAILGNSYSLIDVGLTAMGTLISPAGVQAGELQIGPTIGFLNNMVAVSFLTSPVTTTSTGWAQGGKFADDVGIGLTLNFPFNLGPTSPPVGIPANGPLALPRGNVFDLFHGLGSIL